MRIGVMGTGGVGGYFGAKLALGGHDVTFVARGAHLDAIRRQGLRIESETTPMHVANARATDDARTIGPVDVVMFCVKLWDVESAAAQVKPLVAAGGVVVPFQNGVDAPDILTHALGSEYVLGGIAYIAAAIAEPGVIKHIGTMARLRVGAFEGGRTDRAKQFHGALREAAVESELVADVRRALWEKFVFLAALSGATCLARQPLGVVRSDPDLRATFEAIMRETVAVARRKGVALPDDFVQHQLAFGETLPAAMRASMLNDLVAGHRLEAPWLCGAIVRLGRELGIATPVNATIYAALKPYIAGTPH